MADEIGDATDEDAEDGINVETEDEMEDDTEDETGDEVDDSEETEETLFLTQLAASSPILENVYDDPMV